jgi:hypothetical protein
MDEIWWNVLGGIGLAGLFVAAMNIRQAIFLGVGIGWLALCAMFIISMSLLKQTPTIGSFIAECFSVLGNLLALLLLVSFYALYCVYGNKEYIANGSMPDTWYLFSYFVVGAFALNLLVITAYLKYKGAVYKAISLLLTTLMLGFVIIETIICSHFRTDGFLV